jgi:predicted nucleotidyltransferase component of viral defense system
MATLIQSLQEVLLTKDPALPVETKRILLKEILQAFVLEFLYNHRQYRRLRFYGGSSLRIVYGLNRLSEDIDLDNQVKIDLSSLSEDLVSYFKKTFLYDEITSKEQFSRSGIYRLTLKFPLLQSLGLSPLKAEALHLKLEISRHTQVAEIERAPIFYYGRSFVPAYYNIETMMAAKMLACLERSFQVGGTSVVIKGRDYYDLLWLMEKKVQPLLPKLQEDGKQPYTVKSAMQAIQEMVERIRPKDLAIDLLPLFENRVFIESWIETFHENFARLVQYYVSDF